MFLFGELIKSPSSIWLASYSCANHLTLHPSISLASYFLADHLILHPLSCFRADYLTLVYSCPPFNCPSVHPVWRAIFVSSIPWASYFRADHLILHPLLSQFRAYHITLHLSIFLASCFCAVYPLGELFSCRPYNCPPIDPFGKLLLCLPSLGRVIFVPTF